MPDVKWTDSNAEWCLWRNQKCCHFVERYFADNVVQYYMKNNLQGLLCTQFFFWCSNRWKTYWSFPHIVPKHLSWNNFIFPLAILLLSTKYIQISEKRQWNSLLQNEMYMWRSVLHLPILSRYLLCL